MQWQSKKKVSFRISNITHLQQRMPVRNRTLGQAHSTYHTLKYLSNRPRQSTYCYSKNLHWAWKHDEASNEHSTWTLRCNPGWRKKRHRVGTSTSHEIESDERTKPYRINDKVEDKAQTRAFACQPKTCTSCRDQTVTGIGWLFWQTRFSYRSWSPKTHSGIRRLPALSSWRDPRQ